MNVNLMREFCKSHVQEMKKFPDKKEANPKKIVKFFFGMTTEPRIYAIIGQDSALSLGGRIND